MSSKRRSSIMEGTIRSISCPGRCTSTDSSLPISEVTLSFMMALSPQEGRNGEYTSPPAFGHPPREVLPLWEQSQRQGGDLLVGFVNRFGRHVGFPDFAKPFGEARELFAGRLKLLLRVAEVPAELLERVIDLADASFQVAQLLDDVLRALLDLHPLQSDRDGVEVDVKQKRRDRNHLPGDGEFQDALFPGLR